MTAFAGLDLSRTFTPQDERFLVEPSERDITEILRRMNKTTPKTSSTAARAATAPAGVTRWPSTRASPKRRCACSS